MVSSSRFCVSLLFLCLFIVPVIGQKTETSPKILFILDASGSMWGKVGNEEKIVSAKRVLKTTINDLPDVSHVGLIAYGHRSKSDCNDIETLAPISPLNKTALTSQVEALDPKGKTPITNSLRKAVEEVKAYKSKETIKIVLVSDGLETCEGDPCAFIREAKKAGVNITLHVIGFDVGKLSVAQLECIAQAGNGLYTDADSSDELAGALAEAVSAEVAQFDSRLSVKAIADGKLTDAVVIVNRAGKAEAVTGGRTYDAADTNPRVLPLPAGTYDVTVTAVNLSGSPSRQLKGIKIATGETAERIVDFSAGEVFLEVTRNGKLSDAVVQVFPAGGNQSIAGGRTYNLAASNPIGLRLAPGKYQVVIKSNEISGAPETRLNVTIGGDKQEKLAHDFKSGTLRVGASSGGKLIDTVVMVHDLGSKKDVGSARTYTDAKTNPRIFELQPGRYRVRLSAAGGGASKEAVITINAGETIDRIIEF